MAQINQDFANIGSQFVQHYYNTLDSNPAGLKDLYAAESMLTWEEKSFMGQEQIMTKMQYTEQGLNCKKMKHQIVKSDFQPNPFNNGVMCMITGSLFIDDSTTPVKFAQVMHLAPFGGQYIIINDMFRLNYG